MNTAGVASDAEYLRRISDGFLPGKHRERTREIADRLEQLEAECDTILICLLTRRDVCVNSEMRMRRLVQAVRKANEVLGGDCSYSDAADAADILEEALEQYDAGRSPDRGQS